MLKALLISICTIFILSCGVGVNAVDVLHENEDSCMYFVNAVDFYDDSTKDIVKMDFNYRAKKGKETLVTCNFTVENTIESFGLINTKVRTDSREHFSSSYDLIYSEQVKKNKYHHRYSIYIPGDIMHLLFNSKDPTIVINDVEYKPDENKWVSVAREFNGLFIK